MVVFNGILWDFPSSNDIIYGLFIIIDILILYGYLSWGYHWNMVFHGLMIYSLVMTNVAVEFSVAILNYQRVYDVTWQCDMYIWYHMITYGNIASVWVFLILICNMCMYICVYLKNIKTSYFTKALVRGKGLPWWIQPCWVYLHMLKLGGPKRADAS